MIFFDQIFDATFLLFIAKLSLAMMLGLIIGLERVYAHKTAGMRTYALVAMASAFFVLIAQQVVAASGVYQIDAVMRMASQIIVGVGFLGTGLIIFKDGHIENLTTASGMWAVAAIGMAVGFGLVREAIVGAVLLFVVLGILSFVERTIRLKYFPDPQFTAGDTPKKQRKPRTRKLAVESSE